VSESENKLAPFVTIINLVSESAEDVKELLFYDEDTAGGIMTKDFVALRKDFTIYRAIEMLRDTAPEAEAIYYVFVVDNEEKLVLRGFGTKPVFRVEDTDGEPLEYEKLEVPDLPLIERAHQWNISVKAVPGNSHYYGYYAPGQKEIAIATDQQCVFFHELAHTAHHIVKGDLQPGQDPIQEIVAELSAQALARMDGKSAEDTIGNSYRYIQKYAEKLKLSTHEACLKVIADTQKVLELIITGQVNGKNQTYKKVA
jgi:CBS domain-containing protein